MAVAASLDLEMLQLDIRTAYLYGDVQKKLFMHEPEGYQQKDKADLVCRLQKSIYGLKQSGKNWNDKLHSALNKMGFVRSNSDPNLYIMRKGDEYVLLLVYVDDIIMASNSGWLLKVVRGLSDASEPNFCLGLEIRRDRKKRTVRITKAKYGQSD